MNKLILMAILMLAAAPTVNADMNIDPKAYHQQRLEEKKLRAQQKAISNMAPAQPLEEKRAPANKSVTTKTTETPEVAITSENNETFVFAGTNSELPSEDKD